MNRPSIFFPLMSGYFLGALVMGVLWWVHG